MIFHTLAEEKALKKKRDEVIAKLKELIKTKMYIKGSKLPAERDLADMLGVSRSLLREAIITLEAWGVLESVERQGIFVITPFLSDFTESMQFMPFWLEDLLPQVMEMRWVLSVSAAELAAHRRTDEDLTKMKACIENLKSGNGKTEDEKKERSYWEIMLHNLYISATHNQIMERVNEGLASLIEDWFDLVVSQHEQLVQAIEKKNARKAKAIMIQHLEDSIQKIEKLSEDGLFPFGYKRTLPLS
jgi:GntR family transcriptional regulator, transcriptional repressor for pyruvate dehydrogenase complex